MPKTKSLYNHIQSLGLKDSYLGCYIAAAYADCLPDYFEYDLEGCYGAGRHLKFLLPEPIVAKDLAPYLMLIGDYNGFRPSKAAKELVESFGDDALVFVAREGSACMYIRPQGDVWFSRNELKLSADEVSFDAKLGMFRVWWD